MSLLLFPARVRSAAPDPPPSGETVIAAQIWRWDGESGDVRVTGGFPLRAGLLTEATLSKLRLYIGGVEQSIAVSPLRGRFSDGSLRSVGIQVVRNLTNNTPAVAEVRIGDTDRGTADLTWQEPKYQDADPLVANVLQRAVIAPSDPTYLCSTHVGLATLQPASTDTGDIATFFSPTESRHSSYTDVNFRGLVDFNLSNNDGVMPVSGTATYEHVHGLWCGYLRSGDRFFYEQAHDTMRRQLLTDYQAHVGANATGTAFAFCTTVDPSFPEPVNVNSVGRPAEWHSGFEYGFAVGYWMTAWKQPWRIITYHFNAQMGRYSTYSDVRSVVTQTTYGARYHFQWRFSPALAAYLVEGIGPVSAGYGRAYDPALDASVSQLIQWALDAWEAEKFSSSNNPDHPYLNGVAGYLAPDDSIEHFQNLCAAIPLTIIYEHVYPDPRIPGLMQAYADFVIGQTTQDGSRWVSPYDSSATPTGGMSAFSSMQTLIVGWVYAYTQDPTYLTWLQRFARVIQFDSPSGTKEIGQFFSGWHQATAAYANGVTLRSGPAGTHPVAYQEPRLFTS